jgi:hypothetical protein
LSVGLAVFAGTLQLTELIPKEFFAVWICALFFFFCGMWAVTPSALAKLYGPKNMALNYGFIVSAAVSLHSFYRKYEITFYCKFIKNTKCNFCLTHLDKDTYSFRPIFTKLKKKKLFSGCWQFNSRNYGHGFEISNRLAWSTIYIGRFISYA